MLDFCRTLPPRYGHMGSVATAPLIEPYRVQQPSTVGGNWRWRYRDGVLTPEIARRLLALTRMYDR